MRKFFVIILSAVAVLATAQERRFVIKGEMISPALCYSDGTVNEVKLEHEVDGQKVVVVTSPVKDNRFTFEGVAPDAVGLYNITGFDNGSISVFVEEGEITVGPFDAAYPVAAKIGGTPCNDTYQAYIDLHNKCISESKVRMKAAQDGIPAEIKGNMEEEMKYTSPTFYVNNMHFKVAIMDFIYENIESPVVLYIIKYAMLPTFTIDVIEGFMKALPDELQGLAMHRELMNEIRSAKLKVGSEAPDICGMTPDGKSVALSDLRGKYVFIDIWASWCAPCRREIPFLKDALAYSGNSNNLVVLSYSIDNEHDAWVGCIEKNQLVHRNWVHISTLRGWGSEGVKLLNVKGVPYTVLIDPEGKVVEFGLRGEEMVKKLKGIVDGAGK